MIRFVIKDLETGVQGEVLQIFEGTSTQALKFLKAIFGLYVRSNDANVELTHCMNITISTRSQPE